MPIPNKPRRRELIVDSSDNSWASLEATKSRLASAMDRCEFLASSRNRFTDVAARQTMDLSRALHKKDPATHFSRTLSHSVPDVRKMLDDQRDLLSSSKTVYKRIDQLNKHVVAKEERGQGELGRIAAKTSAKQAAASLLRDTWHTPYDQLSGPMSPSGTTREWPLLAVKCYMPYAPPDTALVHGLKKDPGSTSARGKFRH